MPLTVGGGIKGFKDGQGKEYSALEVAAAYFRWASLVPAPPAAGRRRAS